VSRLLDSAFSIPGTRYRFGLDALIGLVPGLGDAVGAIFSGYIILQASRAGASGATINRMIANVAIDTVVGWVPLLGDLFDVGWKANTKNVALLEQHLRHPAAARAGSRRSLLILGAILLALLVGAVALGVLVAELVLNLFNSLS
jgi:branched-subunit amino acid permease